MTSVTPERTELEWTYEPSDFFEATYRFAEGEYDVLIEDGRAIVNLRVAHDPVNPQLEKHIQTYVRSAFLVRQLQVSRDYNLQGPRVYQHAAGRRRVEIRMSTDALVWADHLDIAVRDAAGNVVLDTRAERIAEQTAILDSVTPKVAHSPLLRSLLESYRVSLRDAGNALVHLYEIRDAFGQHYGGEKTARQAS